MTTVAEIMLVAMIMIMIIAVSPSILLIKCAPSSSPRIYHGTIVPEGKYRFMASIVNYDGRKGNFCGAIVVNDDSVLTAYHCIQDDVDNPSKFMIYLGHVKIIADRLDERFLFRVAKIHHRPLHEKVDMVVMKLERKIDFKALGCKVEPICVAGENEQVLNDRCWAMGWGLNEPGSTTNTSLKEAEHDVVDCPDVFGHMLCVRPVGQTSTCNGDSGSPLVCATKSEPDKLALWGLLVAGTAQCNDSTGLSLYTPLKPFLPWITEMVES